MISIISNNKTMNIDEAIQECLEDLSLAGIDPSKFSPHYFRHAFAIHILSETGNLALAQDLLGHSDPKSTRVYAKIRADDLQKAHKKIFG